METTIYNFYTSLYIPDIPKFAFHLPYVHILGTNHCGEMQRTAFKQCELFQDVLYCRNYAQGVVASFAHQIQSEYYGGNIGYESVFELIYHNYSFFKFDVDQIYPIAVNNV